MKPELSIPFS